jgi:hypothetical protein
MEASEKYIQCETNTSYKANGHAVKKCIIFSSDNTWKIQCGINVHETTIHKKQRKFNVSYRDHLAVFNDTGTRRLDPPFPSWPPYFHKVEFH